MGVHGRRSERSRATAALGLPVVVGLLVCGALPVACGGAADEAPAVSGSTGADEAALDPRIDFLLAPCARGGYYDVATADVTPILEETLLHGLRDPLKRAKAELADMGEDGLVVLRRVVRKYWNQPDGKSHVRNALEAAALGDSPGSRELLLEGLEHPMEDLRVVCLRGLRKHGRPEDYDALFAALAQASPSYYMEVLSTMHAVAPQRTAALVAGWLERGDFEPLWDDVVPFLASAQDPAVVAICATRWADAEPRFRPSLAAPCARAGDPEAMRALDGWLVDPTNPTLRRATALALHEAGLFERLAPMLTGDPAAANRLLAAGFLADTPEHARAVRDYLLAGMGDESADVAQACMGGLISIGDRAGLDAAVGLIAADGSGDVAAAIRLLREPLADDRALAERVLGALERVHAAVEHRPIGERLRVLQVISQVPLAAAAEFLDEQRRRTSGEVQGRRADQWFLLQEGNVGEAATPLLESLLEEPRNEVERLDVLEALSMRGGDGARANMLHFLERDDARPFEILYAADRLVRIGPARIVAPVLKRVCLRVQDPRVRPALQCLLWSSYPGPR